MLQKRGISEMFIARASSSVQKSILCTLGIALASTVFVPIVTINWHCRDGAVKCVTFAGSQSLWGLSESLNAWDIGAVNIHSFFLIFVGLSIMLYALTPVLWLKWLRILIVLLLITAEALISIDISSYLGKWLPYGCSQGFAQLDFTRGVCAGNINLARGFYLIQILMALVLIVLMGPDLRSSPATVTATE